MTDGQPFSPQFLACLPFTLAQECPHPNEWSNPRNFSNDAHDPGGETMCGIIQREYTAWRKSNGLPSRDVRYLTQAEGYAIYWRNYWYPECPKLPPGLDLAFFDAAVNEGGHEAILLLQFILRINRDGDWGPETEAHVAAITDPAGMVQAFTKHREDVYRMFKGFRYFGRDWERRSAEIGAEALRMTKSTPAAPTLVAAERPTTLAEMPSYKPENWEQGQPLVGPGKL